ncbi:hypothetical protein [Actinomyces faecalis]|uniref:hypothetical protein n=1 Tax=Actinomyces faecalis TaxID=2722820 RepID=UPI00155697ED|nr:hypothetical protein [Actinomyces faecalis]
MTAKNRTDLSPADQAWIDRLAIELIRRGDLSTATTVCLRDAQREALIALRAEEKAEGICPTDVSELLGQPDVLAAQLAAETDDEEARAAEERQEIGLVAQICSVMTVIGIYFVLIWPFQILVGNKHTHFGVDHALGFASLALIIGGLWSTIRTALRGQPGLAARRATATFIGIGIFIWAVTSEGWWQGPSWLGVPYGAFLVVVGWHYIDWDKEDYSRHSRHGTPEQWYAQLDRRLARPEMVGRSVRERLVAETRALVGTADPWEELGDPGGWARRLVHEDGQALVSHKRGAGFLHLAIGMLASLAALGSFLVYEWPAVAAWTLTALWLCANGLAQVRGADHTPGHTRRDRGKQ